MAFRQQNYEQSIFDFNSLAKLEESDISPIIMLAQRYIPLNKEKDAIELSELLQDLQADYLDKVQVR